MAVLMGIAGIAVLAVDYYASKTELTEGLMRKTYGKGDTKFELKVSSDDKKTSDSIEVSVSERAYTEEEIREIFDKSIRKMEKWILGDNEKPDRVEADLKLITEIPGEPIDVSWELDRYDVMNVYGELNEERLDENGTPVTLRAVLTYRERAASQALYECTVMLFPKAYTAQEVFVKAIQEKIKERDEETRSKAVLELPENVSGKAVHFYPVMETRGGVLLAMAAFIPVLVIALKKQNMEKAEEERRRQMRLDYPEIVSKLTLLLGAGMTVKRAWRKIAEDACKKEKCSLRSVYAEMRYTCREMESGVTEAESYEHFGRRCGLQEYIRLGALLSQNLRKGTKGLNELLRMESVQAFEERKARAKRIGEEAGTKLLMPMFLMLGEVLIIVIAPAFLSLQI